MTWTHPAVAAETPEQWLQRAKEVLAQVDGTLAIPGLKEPVEVLRDRWGVPHIYAKNQDDLFFAQGFVAAQDRLFQIDLWRRVAVGETSAVLGKKGLPGDRFARLAKYRGNMNQEWTSYSPDTQQIATAFTHGINAYIDHLGDRLPIEFQILGYRPTKWRPEDCLGRMSGIIMSRNFADEISRAELVAAVGIDKARQIAPADPDIPYDTPLDLEGITQAILADYRAATGPLSFAADKDGSNNWAIDGALSASGKPMMASDPHRSIQLPSLRYLVHLHAPGWNVIGSGEPGLPGVALGHNERIAWGFTIVGNDQADIYIEETDPADDTRYKVGDRWEKMTILHEPVTVKGESKPVEVELRFTRHGPVIHQDRKRNRAFVLRWVGSEPGTAAYLGCLALDRVGNWKEFLQAVKRWKLPSENIVYADVDGNIGWVAAALTPIRKSWHGLLPVPGASSQYEWQGFLDVEHYPQVFNPPQHYVATANHNILPDDYPHRIAHEWSPSYRYQQVKRRLESQKQFTLDDMKSIQHDNTSGAGEALVRILKEVKIDDPQLQPYVDLLSKWDGVLTVDSRAATLYAVWLDEAQKVFFGRHAPPHLVEFLSSKQGIQHMMMALETPAAPWFDKEAQKERDELIRQTLARAVARTKKLRSSDVDQWTWGKLHTTNLDHPLASLGAVYAKAFSLPPVEQPGDGLTPNAGRHDANFRKTHGASYRQVFDLADWDRGVATSVPGQSGQPGSPHYDDLLPLWAKGEYFPLVFSRAKVEEVTTNRLLLRPAGK
ncbi:MAG: penicillin acylase family protein [Gemmataceae bacterium]